jgi:radical SAM superfamily enzyme YgiQ (UPF0313 family)
MCVILVNPPRLTSTGLSYVDEIKTSEHPSEYYSLPMEHLGLLSIKASCVARGLEVHVVDGVLSRHTMPLQTLWAIRSAARRADPPVLIGFSEIVTFDETLWLARRCKQAWPNVKLIIGGGFASLNHDRILTTFPEFDYACIGEGENTFALLAKALSNQEAPGPIHGLAWRESDGTVRHQPQRPTNIDLLSWPARDHLDSVRALGFSPAVFASRGCAYRCSFCVTGGVAGIMGKDGYRMKAIGNVVDELEFLRKDHHVEFVCITDDLFVVGAPAFIDRAERFAKELLRRRLDLRFMIDARIDSVRADLFQLLYKAGLRRVFVGIETGSTNQLGFYGKRYPARCGKPMDQIRLLQSIGIEVVPGIIMFHPTVTAQELRDTLSLVDAVGFRALRTLSNAAVAYPGTALYEGYRGKGYLRGQWPTETWEFQGPGSKKMFDQLIQFFESTRDLTFQKARARFLRLVAEWETASSQVASPVIEGDV